MKQLTKFLLALRDDVEGKDANGRNAQDKKLYSEQIIALLAVVTAAFAFTFWPVAVVSGITLARKVQLAYTNTY